MRHLKPLSRLTVILIVLVSLGDDRETRAAPLGVSAALTPRVFLPLQLQAWSSRPPPPSPFGVSDRTGFSLASSPEALNLVTTAGISYNRTAVSWAAIEPTDTTPENYKWGSADEAINSLLQQGIQPFVVILNNPAWAATTSCGPVRDRETLGEFVSALAARYRDVPYWGLYNEADNATFSVNRLTSGGCFGEPDLDANGVPDYADYAELMRVAWKAMHKANPDALLAFGNVAFDNFTPETQPPDYPGGCCFDYHFLDNLFGYMAAHPLPPGDKYGDALGFNNYLGYDIGYWEAKYPPSLRTSAKAAALRDIMSRHGVGFPLVISEMSGSSTDLGRGGVSQEVQARQLVQLYVHAAFSDVKVIIWWTWNDFPTAHLQYGIVDVAQTPKQSYFALQTLIAQLRGYEPTDSGVKHRFVNLGFRKGTSIKRVIYARTDTLSDKVVKIRLAARAIRVTDMLGKVTEYQAANGAKRIILSVNANPVYVEINPH